MHKLFDRVAIKREKKSYFGIDLEADVMWPKNISKANSLLLWELTDPH